MSRWTSLLALGLFLMMLILPALAQEAGSQANENSAGQTSAAQPLTPQALDALTAGVALYPDQVVEAALAAAFNPPAIAAAADLTPQQFQQQAGQYDASIQYLAANAPQLLTQLSQHLSLTTSLGIAAQNQLNDVWASVDRVRAQYQQSTQQQSSNPEEQSLATNDAEASSETASSSGNEASQETSEPAPTYNTYNEYNTASGGGYANGYGSAGAFAAGLVAGNAWQDLYRGRPYYPAGNNHYHNGSNNVVIDNHNHRNATPAQRIDGDRVAERASTARPANLPAANSDWLNGIGNNQRAALATNTWGHMDNQARQSFTGRDGSPANFNNPSTVRPGGRGFNNVGQRNFGVNNGSEPSTARPGFGGSGTEPPHSKFGAATNAPGQGRLSPSAPADQHPHNDARFNASPSRSFGGPGNGFNRGGAPRGGGRR